MKKPLMEGRSELILVITGIFTALGFNPADPGSLKELIANLNNIPPNSPVYYLIGIYVIARAFRKWQKEHYTFRLKELEMSRPISARPSRTTTKQSRLDPNKFASDIAKPEI